jgi:hypothetical protein
VPTYIQKSTTSDLSLGGDGTNEISSGTGTDTLLNIDPANEGGTVTWYFVTPADVPNSDQWEDSGSQTVELEIDVGDASLDCQVRVGRCNSSGSILQTGSFTATQTLGSTVSFSPTAPAWTNGEELCGNRYFVEMLFTNNGAHGNHSIDMGLGTAANEVITDIVEDAGGCAVADELIAQSKSSSRFVNSRVFGRVN